MIIRMVRPGQYDRCRCGLNKKYKHCCKSLDDSRSDRTGLVNRARSLRKNLSLLVGTADIFI